MAWWRFGSRRREESGPSDGPGESGRSRRSEVLGTSPEVSLELVTHLQFREVTEAARRRRSGT